MRAQSGPPMTAASCSRQHRALVVFAVCGAWLCGARPASAEAEMSCVSCPDGLFLHQSSLSCASCPANSRVPDPANASSVLACACANGSAACATCALASYKPALGNATCAACPANTNTTAVARVALAECLCAPGFFFGNKSVPATVSTIVNMARACGANQNAPCPALMPGIQSGYSAAQGNDNIFSTMFYSHSVSPLSFRIDFQTSRTLSHIILFNRNDCCQGRANGGHIQIGDSDLLNTNTVCATLNSDTQQTHTCAATGRYIFIVLLVGSVTVFNFRHSLL